MSRPTSDARRWAETTIVCLERTGAIEAAGDAPAARIRIPAARARKITAQGLEGKVVLFRGPGLLRHRLRIVRSSLSAVEHDHVVCDDLGGVPLHAGVLVIPRARLELSFEVHLAPFLEVLTADLGKLSPCDDIVPFGPLLRVPLGILPPFVRGDRKLCHRNARRGVADLGILSQIPDQGPLVETFSGHKPSCNECEYFFPQTDWARRCGRRVTCPALPGGGGRHQS